MLTLFCNVSAMAVASIFYLWRGYTIDQLIRHQKLLCKRVAFMLWVAANNVT